MSKLTPEQIRNQFWIDQAKKTGLKGPYGTPRSAAELPLGDADRKRKTILPGDLPAFDFLRYFEEKGIDWNGEAVPDVEHHGGEEGGKGLEPGEGLRPRAA